MLSLDTQLNKFGKFRGVVQIGFTGQFRNGLASDSATQNQLTSLLRNKGFTVVSVGVTSSLDVFTYKIWVLSNEDTISNNSNLVFQVIKDNFSYPTFISLGKKAYNTTNQTWRSNNAEDFPNYNTNTINPNSTVVTDNTNLLVSGDYYKVVKGDTLASIAKKFKTTVARLKELNEIVNINNIYVGQAVKVKGSSKVITDTNTTVNTSTGGGGLDSVLETISNIGGGSSSSNSSGGGFLDSLGLGLGISTPVILFAAGVGVLLILKK